MLLAGPPARDAASKRVRGRRTLCEARLRSASFAHRALVMQGRTARAYAVKNLSRRIARCTRKACWGVHARVGGVAAGAGRVARVGPVAPDVFAACAYERQTMHARRKCRRMRAHAHLAGPVVSRPALDVSRPALEGPGVSTAGAGAHLAGPGMSTLGACTPRRASTQARATTLRTR